MSGVSCLNAQSGNNTFRFQAPVHLTFGQVNRCIRLQCAGSAVLCAVCATPVAAESHKWGASAVEYSGGVVTFSNELTTGQRDFNVLLTDGGITLLAIVLQNPGDAPDVLIVQPPPGYISVPESVTVDEGAFATIIVTPAGLS